MKTKKTHTQRKFGSRTKDNSEKTAVDNPVIDKNDLDTVAAYIVSPLEQMVQNTIGNYLPRNSYEKVLHMKRCFKYAWDVRRDDMKLSVRAFTWKNYKILIDFNDELAKYNAEFTPVVISEMEDYIHALKTEEINYLYKWLDNLLAYHNNRHVRNGCDLLPWCDVKKIKFEMSKMFDYITYRGNENIKRIKKITELFTNDKMVYFNADCQKKLFDGVVKIINSYLNVHNVKKEHDQRIIGILSDPATYKWIGGVEYNELMEIIDNGMWNIFPFLKFHKLEEYVKKRIYKFDYV